MNSTMISKIEKARRYAEEPDRARFTSFALTFRGSHDDYVVEMNGADFTCTCHSFPSHGTCAHIMAVQRMLTPMLSEEQQTAGAPFSFSQA
jgi:predicted nucleic acid-binding Zn finger protein